MTFGDRTVFALHKAERKFEQHLRNCRKCHLSNSTFCHTGSFLRRKLNEKVNPPSPIGVFPA